MNRFEIDGLNYEDYLTVEDMYPERETQDIVEARYRKELGYENKADICALPPPINGTSLVAANMVTKTPNRDMLKSMSKTDRIIAAKRQIKQNMRAFLSYQLDLERLFRECLIGAYSQRSSETWPDNDIRQDKNVYSMANTIDSSVPDMSLIGTAGTGKSTSVRTMLKRYPKCIRHSFNDGHQIMQIPYLEATAYNSSGEKGLFLTLTRHIDRILGTDYTKEISQSSVPVMALRIGELIQKYWVAAIIVDEIQLFTDKKIFDQLLNLTANYGVSLVLIGTEDAVTALNKNEWFARRFSHLGRVCSDMGSQDPESVEATLRQLWKHQWTREYYESPSPEIVKFFVNETRGNVDLMASIFVLAQCMVIASEDSGSPQDRFDSRDPFFQSDHPLRLDLQTFKKAASRFPIARQLIVEGISEVEQMYVKETNDVMNAIDALARNMQAKEAENAIRSVAKILEDKTTLLADVINKVHMFIKDVPDKQIEKVYNRLLTTEQDFPDDPGARAGKVYMAIMEERAAKKPIASSKERKQQAKPKKQEEQTNFMQAILPKGDSHDDFMSSVLQTAAS